MLYREICGNYDRELWFTTTDDAKRIGVREESLICDPYKEELHPNEERLTQFAHQLNELINNLTNADIEDKVLGNNSLSLATTRNTTEMPLTTESSDSSGRRVAEEARDMDQGRAKRSEEEGQNNMRDSKAVTTIAVRMKRKITNVDTASVHHQQKTSSITHNDDDDFWLEDLVIEASKFDKASSMTMTFVTATRRNASEDGATDTSSDKPAFVTIDAMANALQLQIPENFFKRYEKIGFFLPGICADFVPSAVDEFNASAFEGAAGWIE
ncbi:unnamed protein product [Anisakis simplex]|uniref:Uncharacterized protein n=1 Tax=Anisakis simplex TaxID=6269 RepID=A0A3P6TMF2_ANISI|nr:unnamed protein product [Anisakis simplex]